VFPTGNTLFMSLYINTLTIQFPAIVVVLIFFGTPYAKGKGISENDIA
jgi:hypothetical protein